LEADAPKEDGRKYQNVFRAIEKVRHVCGSQNVRTVNGWFKQPSCTTSAAILGASATPQRGCQAAMSFDILASSHRDKTC